MNRRLTAALRASAAMLTGCPEPIMVSRAASVWAALRFESRRRSTPRRPAWSGMVALSRRGAFDGGEEGRSDLAGEAAQLDGKGDIEMRSAGADGGDGCFHGAAVVVVQGGHRVVVRS